MQGRRETQGAQGTERIEVLFATDGLHINFCGGGHLINSAKKPQTNQREISTKDKNQQR